MEIDSRRILEKEEEIIRDILNGNVNRYVEIVRAYQTIVANLCYKIGGSNVDVEEVTQQVFVELYGALPRFRFQSKLSTFIYRITLNTVYKELKHKKRFQVGSFEEIPIPTPEQAPPDQRVIEEEQHRQLHQAIGRLKQEQRTAIILYTFDEFSYNEIAEVMQCSTAKVESLIFRARKNLKKMLT